MGIGAINRRLFQKYDVALYVVAMVWISIRVSNYVMWALSIAIVIQAAISNHGRIVYIHIPGEKLVYGIVIVGTATGAIGLLMHEYNTWFFFRDFIRSTAFPAFWIAIGILITKYKGATKRTLYKTLFLLCGMISVVDVVVSMPVRIANMQYGFAGFAGSYSTDKYMMAVGVVLSMVMPLSDSKVYFNKILDFVFKTAIFFNFALSFSRTAIVLVICLVLPFVQKYWGLIFKIIVAGLMAVILMQSFLPDVYSQFYLKIVNSVSEINNNHIWSSATEVSSNWRGYEIYCEQKDFASQGIISQLFGKGFGSSIDVGTYAFLVTSESRLPYLHNGYYTMLMKAGVIGVALNLLFYILNYWLAITNRKDTFDNRLYRGIIISMVISTWVVGGVMISYEIPVFTMILVWLNTIKKDDKRRQLAG